MPSITLPMACACSPFGLTGSPTSNATTALVTRGVDVVQSISTRHAVSDRYSAWKPTPCAVPGGISRPQPPAEATLFSTARSASVLKNSSRSGYVAFACLKVAPATK
jgi:hypothetical protein